jgi:rod shape-determining protein MreB and related proteins
MMVMIIDFLIDSFFSFFSHDLAIDLGSENLRILVRNKGIAVNEPMFGVINKKNKQIYAMGKDAKKMFGRVPAHVKVVRPISEGVIQDFDMTTLILKKHIERLHLSYGLIPKIPKPKIFLAVPGNITSVEKKALKDALFFAGARKVVFISRLHAGAHGAGFDFLSKKGVLIIDFGATTTEVGVISENGIIVSKTLQIGGRTLNLAIVNFIKLKYGLLISEEAGEEMKISVGSCLSGLPDQKEIFVVVRGRDMESSLPRSLRISSIEINEAIMSSVNLIIDQIRDVIEKSPPTFLSDLAESGAILIGASARLPGLAVVIADHLKINAWVTKEPDLAVVRGMNSIFVDIKIQEIMKIE